MFYAKTNKETTDVVLGRPPRTDRFLPREPRLGVLGFRDIVMAGSAVVAGAMWLWPLYIYGR